MTRIEIDGRAFELLTGTPAPIPAGVNGLFAIFAVQNPPEAWNEAGPGSWRLITVIVASDVPWLAGLGLSGDAGGRLLEGYRREGEHLALGLCLMPGATFLEVGSAASDILFNPRYEAAMIDWSNLETDGG